MNRLLLNLARWMKPTDVDRSLKESNPAFDDSSPAQVIERGQTGRIWRMLFFWNRGVPG